MYPIYSIHNLADIVPETHVYIAFQSMKCILKLGLVFILERNTPRERGEVHLVDEIREDSVTFAIILKLASIHG